MFFSPPKAIIGSIELKNEKAPRHTAVGVKLGRNEKWLKQYHLSSQTKELQVPLTGLNVVKR